MQPEKLALQPKNWLRNGNRPGDPAKSPRCGAKTRSGSPGKAPAMRNTRGQYTKCRMHGGASTGPKTPEGKQRSRKANWKTGAYANETVEKRRAFWRSLRICISVAEQFSRQARKEPYPKCRETQRQFEMLTSSLLAEIMDTIGQVQAGKVLPAECGDVAALLRAAIRILRTGAYRDLA